jgi:DNA-binding transcriptional LysR family regulator
VRLTERGALFAEHCRRILAEVEQAERLVRGEDAAPRGVLSVTAPVLFGQLHVLPIAEALLAQHPELEIRLTFVDRVTHLVEEGFDVAVRIAQLPDSTIVARRIGEVRRLLVASPAYLRHRGVPRRPGELGAHELIAFEGMLPGGEWRFVEDGRSAAVALAPRLTVNDALGAIMAAERGEGVTGALSYMVAPQLAAGTLVAVLEELAPPPVPVQIVYPQSRLLAAKVRAFVDFAAPRLARALAPGR